MARRRKSEGNEGVNLDSLMDAMTNVVAVLILVLLLVQADVGQKVVQFLEGLLPASEQQVSQSQKKKGALEQKKVEFQKLLLEEAPRPEEVELEQRQLALLEKSVKENQDLLADLNELKDLERKLKNERDQEATETRRIQEEIARLEALLDQTKVEKVDPTIVGIPASRPIPKNAEIYYALVIGDRVHFIDPWSPLELFEKEFRKAKRDFPNQRIRQQGADRYIYQPGPIVEHFANFDFNNARKQQIKLVARPTSTRLHLVVTPDAKEGGTSFEQLRARGSLFETILNKLRGNSRAVLMFYVHPNSFNTYLEARRMSDRAKVAAGWEIRGSSTYTIRIEDIEIQRQQEPIPSQPGPERPPSLPQKID